MSYQTLKSELTAAENTSTGLSDGIKYTNQDTDKLQGLKDGLIDTIMIPSKTEMTGYLNGRRNYLNSLSYSEQELEKRRRSMYQHLQMAAEI